MCSLFSSQSSTYSTLPVPSRSLPMLSTISKMNVRSPLFASIN